MRRTPRKTPYDTPNNRQPRDSSNGRTPKQLFTPKNDFYASWNPSPAKSRGKNLPSPVKFITEEKDEKDDSQNLSEIIDRLDDSTDAITHNKSQFYFRNYFTGSIHKEITRICHGNLKFLSIPVT